MIPLVRTEKKIESGKNKEENLQSPCPGQGSITFTSYTWNRPASVTLPGGSRKDYVYDPLMRVKQITSRDPAQNVLMNYQYTYDKMDNIITKDTEHGLYTYGYDALYRLTSADNPTLPDESYTYDGVGNRLTSSEASDWTYNPNNELLSYNAITFAYDENGNTVQKTEGSETTYYIYNEEDRLARVEDTARNLIAAYYYDPFGRRLWKEVADNRTCFLYSDEGLIGEYTAADGTETKTYGYKPNSTWTTDPLFMKVGGNYYFYQNDHLSTPLSMSALNGRVVWSAKHESFGEANVGYETITNDLRLPGQYHDQETGLHYNLFRFLIPYAGRYLTDDPSHSVQQSDAVIPYIFTYLIAAPQELNSYSYAIGNPNKYRDEHGLNIGLDPLDDPVPGPAYLECLKKVERRYTPQLRSVITDYSMCLATCDKIREFECKIGNNMKAATVASCKLSCASIYTWNYYRIGLKVWVRSMACWAMYQQGEKQFTYHNTEPE